MSKTSNYKPSTDPQVVAVRDFLLESYGHAVDLTAANWDADAKEVIRLVEQGRCTHEQHVGTVSAGLFVVTCVDCERIIERFPCVKAG